MAAMDDRSVRRNPRNRRAGCQENIGGASFPFDSENQHTVLGNAQWLTAGKARVKLCPYSFG